MALSPRKKTRTVKKEPLKKAQGATSVKKIAARSAALTPKRVPVKKRSAPVRSKTKSVLSVEKSVIAPSVIASPGIKTQSYQEPQRELPDNYGDNQIYLLVRDPFWIYSYWEIQEAHQKYHLEQLGGSWDSVVTVLRVYDTTEKENPSFSDVTLQDSARCWYLNTQPNHSYYVEIGLLHRDGRFICMARSNHVTTPRSGMSEIVDEQWMSVDFEKMYALSGGFQVGKSSEELRRLMEDRLKNAITSGSGAGAVSSLSSPVKIQKRGFHFWLECEIIVYGGTEPDAKVTMQGRPVQLRPDGTFTFRYGLPDGKIIFDCHAESSDGLEERVITPIVSRHTERPAPVLKAGKNK